MTDFQHWPNLFHIGCVYLIKMELYETQLINLSKNNKKVTDIDTGWNSQPLLHRRSRINSIVLKRAFLNINFKRFLHDKSSTQYIESQRKYWQRPEQYVSLFTLFIVMYTSITQTL